MANYPKPKPRAQGEKIPVAGMTFRPGYPGNIQRLIGFFDGMKPQEQLEGVVAVLVRDPANEYDPNAVEVHVPMLGIDGSMNRSETESNS